MQFEIERTILPVVRIIASAPVDGVEWYTIRTFSGPCCDYIRGSDTSLWYEHKMGLVPRFDVHKNLMTLILLQWS